MGKSLWLFPTFFSILITVSPVSASQWPDLVYNFLGLPQTERDWFTESYLSNGYISVSTGYNDVYRKKIDGQTTLTFAEQGNKLHFGWPFKIGKIRHAFFGEYDRNYTYFNNLNDETSFVSRLRIANTNYAMGWHMEGDIFHFDGRYENICSSAPFTIDITAFPHSENATTNQYFFDLLEPTFGRELNNILKLEKTGFSIWLSTRLNKRWRIGAALNYTDFATDWQIRYVNSSPYDSLAGNRKINIPLNGFARIYKFSLFSPGSGLQNLSLICFMEKFSSFVDNNRPNTKDKSSLGNGSLGRSGVALTNHIKRKTWEFNSGLSVANYTFQAHLNTPVIGYYWGFLPISHSAEATLSRGKTFSQQIGITKNIYFKNINLQIGSKYTHTLFDFWIKGVCYPFNGLFESNPIDYPFKYNLHLFDLHVASEWRKGPFGLTYTFRQLLPAGKRLDDSPIRFVKKTPGVKYANRGGQQHQINLAYYF